MAMILPLVGRCCAGLRRMGLADGLSRDDRLLIFNPTELEDIGTRPRKKSERGGEVRRKPWRGLLAKYHLLLGAVMLAFIVAVASNARCLSLATQGACGPH
jgi:hypothetical protein